MAACNLVTSVSRRALITMHCGYLSLSADSISACAATAVSVPAPTTSILLNMRMRGTSCAPISLSTASVTASCRSKPGSLASITWSSSEDSAASSSVDLNDATRSCGRFLIKPTVSLTSTRGTVSGWSARTVVSRVANSLLATSTSLPVSARIKVDLPALV